MKEVYFLPLRGQGNSRSAIRNLQGQFCLLQATLCHRLSLNTKLCDCKGCSCRHPSLSLSFLLCRGFLHTLMQLWYLKRHRANPEECLLHSYRSSHKNVNSLVRSHGRRFPHLTCAYSYAPFSKVTCKSSREQSSSYFSKLYRRNDSPVPGDNLFKLTNSLSHFNPKLECLDYSMVWGDCLRFFDYHLDTAP